MPLPPVRGPQRSQFPYWRRDLIQNLFSYYEAGSPSSVVTPSASYNNNTHYLLTVDSSEFDPIGAGNSPIPQSISGGGLTWTFVGSVGASSFVDLSLWHGYTTSGATSGTLTLTFEGEQIDTLVIVDRVNTLGDQPDIIIQFAADTDGSVTLSSFNNATNLVYGAFLDIDPAVLGPDTGYGLLGSAFNGFLDHLITVWKDREDTSVTVVSSDPPASRCFAVEIGIPPLTLTPDPVTIPSAVAPPTLRRIFLPSPVTIPTAIGTPAVQKLYKPDAVAIPAVIPDPTVAIGQDALTPDPVTIPSAVPAITLRRIFLPTPITLPTSIPTPRVYLLLDPDPVTIPTAIAAPTVVRRFLPSPITIPTAIPQPVVFIEGSTLTPDPVQIVSALANTTVRHIFKPTPITIPTAIGTPSLLLVYDPDVVVITTSVPEVTVNQPPAPTFISASGGGYVPISVTRPTIPSRIRAHSQAQRRAAAIELRLRESGQPPQRFLDLDIARLRDLAETDELDLPIIKPPSQGYRRKN